MSSKSSTPVDAIADIRPTLLECIERQSRTLTWNLGSMSALHCTCLRVIDDHMYTDKYRSKRAVLRSMVARRKSIHIALDTMRQQMNELTEEKLMEWFMAQGAKGWAEAVRERCKKHLAKQEESLKLVDKLMDRLEQDVNREANCLWDSDNPFSDFDST